MTKVFGNSAAYPAKGNILSMDRFRSGKSLSPLRQAEAYWSALRNGVSVPRRARIDPRGLGNVLEYAFILERIAPGVARFRLAGHHLNDLAGMEVRGMPLTALFTPNGRNQISAVLEHMFDAPAVAELSLHQEARRRQIPGEARMILLPLENDLGVVNRALGVLVADNTSGHTPIRFDIGTTNLRPVNGPVNGPVTGQTEAPGLSTKPIAGFAEAQEPMVGPVPHLRLVK